MVTFLFVLGRPGSGKSTAVYHIMEVAHHYGWQTVRIKDYDILYEMFLRDVSHKRFRQADFGAFDVVDFTVLDEVLQSLKAQTLKHVFAETKKLVIIEFARDRYHKALEYFSEILSMNTYFLLTEANVDNCMNRIQKRVCHQVGQDNHYISAEILKGYYSKDNRLYFSNDLVNQQNIEPHKISIVDNDGSYSSFIEAIDQFIKLILLGMPIYMF